MNNAIKLAIEKGGYLKNWGNGNPPAKYRLMPYVLTVKYLEDSDGIKIPIERVTQDPLFWQAFSKAVGNLYPDSWKPKAMEYFDLVLTGGDVDAFWKGLLNEKV